MNTHLNKFQIKQTS